MSLALTRTVSHTHTSFSYVLKYVTKMEKRRLKREREATGDEGKEHC